MEAEQKKLLPESRENSSSSINSYGSAEGKAGDDLHGTPGEGEAAVVNHWYTYIYVHRAKIPGYGMVHLLLKASPYALYVLVAMLIAYLLNQLDRYTLPVVTSHAGAELRYGDKTCQVNNGITAAMWNSSGLPHNTTDLCTDDDLTANETLCLHSPNVTFDYNGTDVSVCRWWWDGKGLLYQIVAGPVFNNLYPLAGVFTGFLADYGNRKVWLVISLVFWSLATGVTGFAQQYWHLVILRALLAIGAAGCSPFAVSILSDYFPLELRGTALGVYYWGIYFGYSLAYAIGNGITEVLNWRWVFFISGIAGIVVAPIILITVKEPKRTKTAPTAEEVHEKISTAQRIVMMLKTFLPCFMPGMFLLCIAGGIRNAGGYVWAYNTQVFFNTVGLTDKTIESYMSWIPLVAGSLGAVVGGLISDLLVKNRGAYTRIWVLIVSQILAAPFAAGALFLPSPWCFITLIPSNVIGEMWVGVTTAIVVDLAPSKIRTAAVALYLFIITIIGGNFNVLVAPLRRGFEGSFDKLTSYRWSLFLTFPGLYALSSLLFLFTFFLMRCDLRRKSLLETNQYTIVNADEDEGYGEVEGEVGYGEEGYGKGVKEEEEGKNDMSLPV